MKTVSVSITPFATLPGALPITIQVPENTYNEAVKAVGMLKEMGVDTTVEKFMAEAYLQTVNVKATQNVH